MSTTLLRIDPRFRGPPTSGNGGYVAGLVARPLGATGCVVTLKAPPPLGEDLWLDAGTAEANLLYGEAPIATAVAAPIDITVPAPPTHDAAGHASTRFTGFCQHNFPGCFVCGPERGDGDGLRIFPGRLDDTAQQVAALWMPDADLFDDAGLLLPEFVWAALDCPGYFAVQEQAGLAVLGRIGANLYRDITRETPLIVTGWPITSEGRKHVAGTALHDEQGTLLAAALSTWITIDAPARQD
ncbi:hypothetical protein [Sphingomonas cavernae]|uniref:Thioesterase family protein n=1 Tax=Sphingomonas cavernae TaxID=2320861 RepID=A0A418W6I5_9SPHN|nr:hypothetical protein [Sphingomonas cavernae]RJF85641.1 hypothetical protein D3876_17205 [Sphingomonas cavernae]